MISYYLFSLQLIFHLFLRWLQIPSSPLYYRSWDVLKKTLTVCDVWICGSEWRFPTRYSFKFNAFYSISGAKCLLSFSCLIKTWWLVWIMKTWRNSSYWYHCGKEGPNNLLFEQGRLTPCFHMQFATSWIESFQWSGIPDDSHPLAIIFPSPHASWFILGESKDAVYVPALSIAFAEFAGGICTLAAKATSDMSSNVWSEP